MQQRKILLVEDAPDVQVLVHSILGKKFELKVVSNTHDALAELDAIRYSLILLDIGLPDEDGFKFCARLKVAENLKTIPIIFLSGKQASSDKVFGFSLGADDYIVKPFDPLEFEARIDARMRRLNETPSPETYFANGEFKVNGAFQKIFIVKNGVEVDLKLTTLEFKILYYFLAHPEHVLSREQLLDHIWGGAASVSDRTVDTHVYTLRQKLGKNANYIRSVPRVGYKFSLEPRLRD